MDKRRRSERDIVFTGAIEVEARLPSGDSLKGYVHDISYEGIRIHGDTQGVRLGDQIILLVRFPFGHDAEYECEVRHISEGESYGVQLKDKVSND